MEKYFQTLLFIKLNNSSRKDAKAQSTDREQDIKSD